jgi:hypothetical protein
VTFVTPADNDIIFATRIVMAPIVVMYADANVYWTRTNRQLFTICRYDERPLLRRRRTNAGSGRIVRFV